MHKRVLVVSAHTSLDRRIIAEMNTLVEAGWPVTFLTVPIELPTATVDPRINVIIAREPLAPVFSPKGPSLFQRAMRVPRGGYQLFKNFLKVALPKSLVKAIQKRRQQQVQIAIQHDPFIALKWYQNAVDRLTHMLALAAPIDHEIIHCHDLETLPAAIAIRAKCPNALIVYDSHELFAYQNDDPLAQRFWSELEQRTIREADAIIAVNQSIAELLSQMYSIVIPHVILNSYSLLHEPKHIPLADFHALFGTQPSNRFKVLFQGSLSEYRNLPNLVRAFGLLDTSYELYVIGTGPYEEEMKSIIKELQLTNVYMGGWVEQEYLISYTRHADLGIIPYVAKEGVLNMQYCTPNKLFEFTESCIPICSSDLPELRRLLTTCGNGKAYHMVSADEIAAAIVDARSLCEQGAFPKTVLEQAREICAWRKQAETLIDIYRNLDHMQRAIVPVTSNS